MNDLMLLGLMSPILIIFGIMVIWGEILKVKDRENRRKDSIIRKNRIMDKELKWEFENVSDKVVKRGNMRDKEIIDYVNKLVKEKKGGENIN